MQRNAQEEGVQIFPSYSDCLYQALGKSLWANTIDKMFPLPVLTPSSSPI